MSEEIPKAVFLCKDKNCNKTHYHLDPEIDKLEHITEEQMTDRPEVKVIPDKTTP